MTTAGEHYAWAAFYSGEIDALPQPWDTASRELATAFAAAGHLHVELARHGYLADPQPLCRDPHEVEVDVPTLQDPESRMVVTVFCARDAGHPPTDIDGGHRSLDGRDLW